MSIQEKEKILKDISKLDPKDKAFVLGYCAHAVATNEQKEQPGYELGRQTK